VKTATTNSENIAIVYSVFNAPANRLWTLHPTTPSFKILRYSVPGGQSIRVVDWRSHVVLNLRAPHPFLRFEPDQD
jgi:hypothetical protein